MTIYIVCPENLEQECRANYSVAKDNEVLGSPTIYTDLSEAVYLVWGSSRITEAEATALTAAVDGVEFWTDEIPSAYFKKEEIAVPEVPEQEE